MWKRLQLLWPGQAARRRLALVCAAAGVVALAFCWGRWGAMPQATAQAPAPGLGGSLPVLGSSPGYDRREVAYIYNSPITREELGEYLIARFGPKYVEFLVNRRIIERECQLKGIVVTDAEVEAQLVEDLRNMNCVKVQDFVTTILRRFNKTLYEYKEDVIRPKLAMAKLVRPSIAVTEEDLQKGFEAHYGPKVKCRMIVLSKDQERQKNEIWGRVSQSKDEFDKAASHQFIKDLAANAGGGIPPINKHFGDQRIEDIAFKLQVGEVSTLIGMPDGTTVILRCEEHIPADKSRRLEDERIALHREITEIKLAQAIPQYFVKLRAAASPNILLPKEEPLQEELVRRTNEVLRAAAAAREAPNGQKLTPPRGN
jgi:hypothetical protein